jgi:hypothetical protein
LSILIGVLLGAKAIKKGEAFVPACSKGLADGTDEKLRNPFMALGGQLISRLILESTSARGSRPQKSPGTYFGPSIRGPLVP